MRVFVTGASGFIGDAVARAFARGGHRVLGLVRGDDQARALERDGIEAVRGTLQDVAAWRARAEECSVVVHCAFDYAGGGFAADRAVVEALTERAGRRGNARTFVYTSGVWVYGDTGGRCVDESVEPRPAKLVEKRVENEEVALGRAREGMNTCVVRPGVVYGASGSLTSAWFEAANERRSVKFFGSGEQTWAMVHRDDLAELYVRVAESGGVAEVFNAVASHASVGECARAVARVGGVGAERMGEDEAQKKLGALVEPLGFSQWVDAGKAARVLGWRARHLGFVSEVDSLMVAWRARVRGS